MKRLYTAYFFVFLLFLSNIGIGIYRHWCGCKDTLFVSVGRALESHCCKKELAPVAQQSCCSKPTKSQCASDLLPEGAPRFSKKCCSSDSDFWVGQSSVSPSPEQLPVADVQPLLPVFFSPSFSYAASLVSPHTSAFRAYQRLDSPPRPAGRDRLNWIQVYRC